MRLSLHADYSFRVLIYMAAHPGETASTASISRAYGISRHHLVRVVKTLEDHGYLNVTAGRSGGVELARPPQEIRLGQVVRDVEPNLALLECFQPETNTCPIIGVCGLKAYLRSALSAFLTDLDRHTLADMTGDRQRAGIATILHQIGQPAAAASPAASPAKKQRRKPAARR